MLQLRDWPLSTLPNVASRRFAVGGVSAALVAVLMFSLVPQAVSASESADHVGKSGSVVEKGSFPRPHASGSDLQKTSLGMWTWSQGRRASYLTGRDDTGFGSIAAVDLDSGDEIGSATLHPKGFGHSHEMRVSGQGERATVVVDEAGGRLFVAYHLPPLGTAVNVAVPETDSLSGLTNGSACVIPIPPPPSVFSKIECVGGVQVLDAGTLESAGPLMRL